MSGNLTAVREMSGNLLKIRGKILSGKSCLKLFIVSCIFASIQVFQGVYLQLLEILEISWNLKTLLEILEISWNLNGPPGNFCVMIEN